MPPGLRSLPSTLFVPSPSLRLTLLLCPSLPEPSPFALARPRARANPKPGEPFLRFSVVWFEGEGSPRGPASGRGLACCFCCRCSCASPSHVGQCGGAREGDKSFFLRAGHTLLAKGDETPTARGTGGTAITQDTGRRSPRQSCITHKRGDVQHLS